MRWKCCNIVMMVLISEFYCKRVVYMMNIMNECIMHQMKWDRVGWDGDAYLEGEPHKGLVVQAGSNVHHCFWSSPCSHLASSLVESCDGLSGSHILYSPEQDLYHSLTRIFHPFHGICTSFSLPFINCTSFTKQLLLPI